MKAKGLKVIIVFEGRDTAGKGGMHQGFQPNASVSARLPHRCAAGPSESTASQSYMQRYIEHFRRWAKS